MDITQKSKVYVTNLLTKCLPEKFSFHNLDHTQEVVDAVKTISKQYSLNDDEMEILMVSAWFHDTGFIHFYENHEMESMFIAQSTLQDWGYDAGKTQKILDCISATRFPNQPTSLPAEILCDADFYHLSQPDYWGKNALLRKERSFHLGLAISEQKWYAENLDFLKEHQYFTQFGKESLELEKRKHFVENIFILETLEVNEAP